MRRVYEYIACELEEEDRYFVQQLKMGKKDICLKKRFLDHPYIRALGICYENETETDEKPGQPSACGITKEKFSDIVWKCLQGMNVLNIYIYERGRHG